MSFRKREFAALVLAMAPGTVFGQSKPDEPIKTTICELLKTPERFNGKMVQVRGTVWSGLEQGGVADWDCGFVLSDSDGFAGLSGRTGEYAFIKYRSDVDDPKGLNWKPIQLPSPIRLVENDSFHEMEKYRFQGLLERKDGSPCLNCPLFEVTVTVVGRFDHVEGPLIAVRDNPEDKPKVYPAGFGHLSDSRNRLVWQSVSDVVATPIDPAVYEQRK